MLELEQVILQPMFKGGNIGMTALALGGPAIGEQQVVPSVKLLIHGLICLLQPAVCQQLVRYRFANGVALHQGITPRVQGRCYLPGRFLHRRGQEQTPPFFASVHKLAPVDIAGREMIPPRNQKRTSSSRCAQEKCGGHNPKPVVVVVVVRIVPVASAATHHTYESVPAITSMSR